MHPRGVRLIEGENYIMGDLVSIHAPTWGATLGQTIVIVHGIGFNSRTHVGCDM